MFSWLRDEHNRGTVSLLVTVIAALLGGAWAVFVYIYPPNDSAEHKPSDADQVSDRTEIYGCYGEFRANCSVYLGSHFEHYRTCAWAKSQTEPYQAFANEVCEEDYSKNLLRAVGEKVRPGVPGDECGYGHVRIICEFETN